MWPGRGAPLTFPTLTRNRLLLDDVTRAQAADARMPPIFRYYAYNLADAARARPSG